jgi:hypothetical protein
MYVYSGIQTEIPVRAYSGRGCGQLWRQIVTAKIHFTVTDLNSLHNIWRFNIQVRLSIVYLAIVEMRKLEKVKATGHE